MWQSRIRRRLGQRIVLTALLLGLSTSYAAAQGGINSLGGGAGSGGGLNSTGGGGAGGGANSSIGGTTGTSGTSTPIGSGNISALTNGTGLASLTNTSTGGGAKGGAGTITIPAASDPFSSFYINPYGTGIIGTTNNNTSFGQPVYPITAATTPTTSTVTASKASTATGFNSIGVRKAPAYVTAASEDLPMVRHNPAKLQFDLQQTLARSSAIKSKNNIRVEVLAGSIVRLTGSVTSARDQRLAEGLIRMTPGVQNVENELQVASQVGLNR